jgi:hypothetical protein
VRLPALENWGAPLMEGPTLPPLNWLFNCSDMTLQDFELAALARGAKNLKIAKAAWEEATRQFAAADTAGYLRAHREEILEIAQRTIDVQAVLEFPARKSA